ncbi:hypothetical protein F5B19DRAFT_498722 [Rostrohypoxylon terebratum]|nr:hypothetical protein F5B19DRAFT_498722 [Rostrohypoxylon terebratum]
MSKPSEITYETHITKLQAQLAYFTNTNILSNAQDASLQNIITLFGDETEGLSQATKSRHRAAQSLLRLIISDLGCDVFFLCIFALPTTSLGTMKGHAEFINKVRIWWAQAKVPSSFHQTATELCRRHEEDILSKIARTTVPTKRIWTIGQQDEAQTFESSPKRHRGEYRHGLDRATESGLEHDDEDVEDEEEVDEEDRPLVGVVYELQPMDAIYILSSSKVNVLLTMPHRRGAKPFISVNISEKVALRFLTKGKQVMELSQPHG